MQTSILITRSISEVPQLEAFCHAQKIHLIAESFIDFAPVKASIPSNIETIFFGSRRAVDYFLLQAEIPVSCEIACIGASTAAHLQKLGYRVHFTGTKAGDPQSVAEELKSWLGMRKLYVAQSAQSNRSMAKALPENQTEAIILYETISISKVISTPLNWIVFTSPSNLEGFLSSNSVSPETQIIAWGKTTEKALQSNDLKADFVLESASEAEIISILKRFS